MLFRIDSDSETIESVDSRKLSEMGFHERSDLEEWIIQEPRALGENLLILTSEFEDFRDTRDRLDLLALDPGGKLVVIELKRDHADKTTDLQAIKYASYCSTLTAQEIQEEYQIFRESREGGSPDIDTIGQRFTEFLSEHGEQTVTVTEEGWADFDLDNRPRIILAAGSFGTEVTSPVMWLTEEYGLDITCVEIESYEYDGDLYLAPRQLIPIPEAEEYKTRRREKAAKQSRKEWNGRDFYVQFGEGVHRSWDDARIYGFVAAGHGEGDRTFSKQLEQLKPGHRVFVRIPGEGYVGVGDVTQEATRVNEFTIQTEDGEEIPILDADLDADRMGEDADDPTKCEYLVGVDWIETRDIDDAYWEKGMWFYRHIACPIYQKNQETLNKLYAEFCVER